jgi:hypothetical protein
MMKTDIGQTVFVVDEIDATKQIMFIKGEGKINRFAVPPRNEKGSNVLYHYAKQEVPVVKLSEGKEVFSSEYLFLCTAEQFSEYRKHYAVQTR